MNIRKNSASGGILAKDYEKRNGKIVPKGTLFQCDRETYLKMKKEGYFGQIKRRSKTKKVEENKDE